MSVQYGRWNFDGKPVDADDLARAEAMLAPYGSDYTGSYTRDSAGILYSAFHTTKESKKEVQPCLTPSGTVVTWDGRLDNREELAGDMKYVLTVDTTDVAMVAAAYETWGVACFSKLIGDWALSIWEPRTRSLILAKDPVGSRHLYYSFDNSKVTWSTILDPLVLLSDVSFTLEEEYVAGWLASFPAAHLTPFVGIHSVPPACLVCLHLRRRTVSKYWDFVPSHRIHYRTDAEYEEHFRHLFREAIRRRLRSDHPVLAELSGGMDSSSIVCVADEIIAAGNAETPRLDTVSYYDDSEPNWNERPYFTKVEGKRGRAGCHIDLSPQKSLSLVPVGCRFPATPASNRRSSRAAREFAAHMTHCGHRVLLSGTGGDEFTGGVPTPIPELEDLLSRAQIAKLAHRLKIWALHTKQPWLRLLWQVAKGFLPPLIVDPPDHKFFPPWLNADFVRRNCAALGGYDRRRKLFGPLPTFQENLNAVDALRRQLACQTLPSEPCYERRYPFLDRSLLEYLCGIPREQLVRPGQRRSLMRRALIGIVPEEIMNKRRKAYVGRTPLAAAFAEWNRLTQSNQSMLGSSLKIFDGDAISEACDRARQGHMVPVVTLIRTLAIEFWLRGLQECGVLGERSPILAWHDSLRASPL